MADDPIRHALLQNARACVFAAERVDVTKLDDVGALIKDLARICQTMRAAS